MQKGNNENVTLKTTCINLYDISMRKVTTGINYKLHARRKLKNKECRYQKQNWDMRASFSVSFILEGKKAVGISLDGKQM